MAEEIEVEEGDVLIEEGTPGHDFFVVVDGALDVVKEGRGRVDVVGPEDFVGETALLSRRPRNATVTAAMAASLLRIGDADFVALLERMPLLWLKVAGALADTRRRRVPPQLRAAVRFSKWHALGNSYLVVEQPDTGPLTPSRVRRLCSVETGIGSDGVLEIVSRDGSGATVTIWNPTARPPRCPGTVCGSPLLARRRDRGRPRSSSRRRDAMSARRC